MHTRHAAARWAWSSCFCVLSTTSVSLPELFIRLGEVTHIYYSSRLPGVKLPVQLQRCETWRERCFGLQHAALAGLQYATLCNSSHCWRDLHKLNRNLASQYKKKKKKSKERCWKEKMSLNPNWDFYRFSNYFMMLVVFSGTCAQRLSAEQLHFWRRQQSFFPLSLHVWRLHL